MSKFLITIFLLSCFAFAKPVDINESLTFISVKNYIEIYKDDNNSFNVNDILNSKTLSTSNIGIMSVAGVMDGTYWLRLDIKNTSKEPLTWALDIPRLNTTGYFYLKNQKSITKINVDDSFSYLNFPMFVHTSTSAPGDIDTLIFHLSFKDVGYIYPQITLSSVKYFDKKAFERIVFKSLMFGAVFALLIYNLFLLFSFRSKEYFWYCIYMTCVVMFLLAASGFGHEFIWGFDSFITKNIFSLTYPLLFAASLQFSRTFLKTKVRFKVIDKVLLIGIIFFIAVAARSLLGHSASLLKLFIFSSVLMSFLPILGIYTWLKGYKEARFYSIAWGAWAIGIMPTSLMLIGVHMDYDAVTMMARIGLVSEALLLSFALADQINILRDERNLANERYEKQRTLSEINSRFVQMGQMIAAIGHQWKQPLQLMSLHIIELELSMRDMNIKISNEIKNELNKMSEVVNYMSNTIDDFKNFFSPSKAKTNFSLNLMIDSVIKMIGKQYSYDKISIEVCVALDIKVYGRENELKQVVMNLLNNARDAFLANNTQNRVIKISIAKIENNALLSINDNAGGIAKDILYKIFDQYFTTKGEMGTGIGLHICKTIIESGFNGTIEATNTNEDATFTIAVACAL